MEKKMPFRMKTSVANFWGPQGILARTSRIQRSDRIYSSRNWGVKKGPGPRGMRNEEFLVPSLISTNLQLRLQSCIMLNYEQYWRRFILEWDFYSTVLSLKPSQNKKGRKISSCTKNGVFFSAVSSKKKAPFLFHRNLFNFSVQIFT